MMGLKKKALAAILAVLAVAGGAACSGIGQAAGGAGTLVEAPNPTGPFTENFNPLLPSSFGAAGDGVFLVYEPLMMPDYATRTEQPWLVTATAWSNEGRRLTLHVRSGVRWSDGTPLTAADVAFTFQLLIRHPALNSSDLPLVSASVGAGDTAVVDFSQPAYTLYSQIVSIMPVPRHIWLKIGNPVTYTNPHPVGTGPYTLSSFTPQVLTFTKNSGYWQASKVSIQTVKYLSFDSAPSEEVALKSGQIDWAIQDFTDFKNLVADKNIGGMNADPGSASVYLMPNDSVYPLNLLAVRKAIDLALSRTAITAQGLSGLQAPISSATGLSGGLASDIVAPYQGARVPAGDPAAAKALLEQAGFKLVGNQFRTPRGVPLQFQILVGSEQTNLLDAALVAREELSAAGIGLTVETENVTSLFADERLGHYQIVFYNDGVNFNPVEEYGFLFGANHYAPSGTSTIGDLSRWNDAATARAFTVAESSNPSGDQYRQAVRTLEGTMVNQLPVIPLFTGVEQATYRTDVVQGWPPGNNPNPQPQNDNPNVVPLMFLLHLVKG
jgi:peptide/nickel transport system substrate-binding protein